ncbi:tyrosine-protein phosphatase non-receptor type 18 [Pseudoliparis swirei]|uniref:tyrosine-protein phosphatase non-receptor type 18 n=1 Tax=Pseudoliparis swirei TaxID=2059687 RepID=UPI0024BDDFFA|nr:tyrosine-protein phosphatase non-receptor type 18 [Pseudoliparis swirei]XP_056279036.1 tyrosine-protein phosphatase non-receptor type 18 [Pseudoliparis swirei]
MNDNDTYAVVKKLKYPPSDPAPSAVATPRFSRPPPSHHYDNDPPAAPVYSVVKPRVKPHGPPLSATPLYDMPPPANHRPGDSGAHHLSPAGGLSLTNDDYEDFCSSGPEASGSPGGIGFNCRIQKPRGPRDPPADWGHLDR